MLFYKNKFNPTANPLQQTYSAQRSHVWLHFSKERRQKMRLLVKNGCNFEEFKWY
uniref:Uncharacterized protein n=1 Tax=Anguilla anguilla TaxID=7936 RepID=A0A0E9TWD3_ANGAN